jgi:predicted O-methyltransferase YrrM
MTADKIIYKISTFIPDMHGWCTVDKASYIAKIILDKQLKNGVELGVFGGRSLVSFGFAFAETGGVITGIDPWKVNASLEGTNSEENDEWWAKLDYEFFLNYTQDKILEAELENTIRLMRMKSSEAIRFFDDNSLDFIHQDSNHSEEISCDEVNRWHSKLKSGGVWVADDTNWKTTQRAQTLLVEKGFTEIYSAPNSEWKVYIKN